MFTMINYVYYLLEFTYNIIAHSIYIVYQQKRLCKNKIIRVEKSTLNSLSIRSLLHAKLLIMTINVLEQIVIREN